MSDYIKREDAIEAVTDIFRVSALFSKQDDGEWLWRDKAEKVLAKAPSADVVDCKRGEWKWAHGGICSECGYHNTNFDYNFCPNCGADMRAEQTETQTETQNSNSEFEKVDCGWK